MSKPETLHISDDLELPINAVTQTFAFIARRGAGKTYAASKLAEQMLTAHMQVVVLDPVGNWYGLRLAADGKSRGFEIPVFGGEHGDLPLAVSAGALIADLVVDRGISVVLDLSSFRKGERKTFATDFAEQFFHRKKTARTPVHVFVEEAQVFVPERPAKGEERMLGAFVDLIRLGRNYGIGASLITQRPQSVSKEALNQTEALVVLQTGGAHERKALAEWIVYQGIESKAVLDDVPSLPAGTAYLWSPQWLGVLKKIKISKKVTFDASATPEMGAKVVEPKTLAPVDLQAIRDAMKTVVQEAEAKDPTKLRARIAELERQVKAAPKAAPAAAKVERVVERVEIPVFKDGEVKRLEAALTEMTRIGELLVAAGKEFSYAAGTVGGILQAATARPAPMVTVRTTAMLDTRARPAATPRPPSSSAGGAGTVTAPQQRILDALAWLVSIGVGQAAKVQLALLAEQSPTSSGYTNNLGALRTAGLISYPAGGQVQLTEAGQSVANTPATPPTTEDLQRTVLARLGRSKAEILRVLIDNYPYALEKEVLAGRAGQSPTSSGFTNNLGSLRSLGLIGYPAPGRVVALPVLFLE